MKFTTSWDDGHRLDLKLVSLLQKYGITGTLYIPRQHDRVPSPLTASELRNLSHYMEIGAHTLTHPDLTTLSVADAEKEIRGSKEWLEAITGTACHMFCYPCGKWNDSLASMVRQAGFHGARTTENFCFAADAPFAWPSTVHVYHFPLRPVWNRRCLDPAKRAWDTLDALRIPWIARRNWLSMAKAVFMHAYNRNLPWFHLRGHSWELETTGMWKDVETFLHFVSQFPLEHVTNGELLATSVQKERAET